MLQSLMNLQRGANRPSAVSIPPFFAAMVPVGGVTSGGGLKPAISGALYTVRPSPTAAAVRRFCMLGSPNARTPDRLMSPFPGCNSEASEPPALAKTWLHGLAIWLAERQENFVARRTYFPYVAGASVARINVALLRGSLEV